MHADRIDKLDLSVPIPLQSCAALTDGNRVSLYAGTPLTIIPDGADIINGDISLAT